MIAAARQLQSVGDEYRVADVQDLGFIDAETFDLAVSYLNQCDLPDFGANTREVFRVLKPAARFVVANLHPMRSAVGTWHRTDDGEKLHVIVDRYFDEGERHWKMMGVEITNFHRTLTAYVDGFLDAGFAIEASNQDGTISRAALACAGENYSVHRTGGSRRVLRPRAAQIAPSQARAG